MGLVGLKLPANCFINFTVFIANCNSLRVRFLSAITNEIQLMRTEVINDFIRMRILV